MVLWRWLLYGMAFYAAIIGIWDHSWRLILAGLAVWVIYPLISTEIGEVAHDSLLDELWGPDESCPLADENDLESSA